MDDPVIFNNHDTPYNFLYQPYIYNYYSVKPKGSKVIIYCLLPLHGRLPALIKMSVVSMEAGVHSGKSFARRLLNHSSF